MQPELSFQHLLEQTLHVDNGISEIIAPAQAVSVTDEGAILAGNRFPFAEESTLTGVLREVGAPAEYFAARQPDLRALAVARHIERGDLGRYIGATVQNGAVTALFRGDLIRLSNADVLNAVSQGVGEAGTRLFVARIEIALDRLEVDLVTPDLQIEVRAGDIVRAGLQVSHYPLGQQATVVQSYLQRLVCTNGMTRRECASRRGPRTRKLPIGHPNGHELQIEQVRSLTTHNWQALQPQLEALKQTAEERIHVEPVLSAWLRQARLSNGLMDRLRQAWVIEGREETSFGLINAVTRVATHDHSLNPRERRLLAALGGIIAFSRQHVCPRCFSILRDG